MPHRISPELRALQQRVEEVAHEYGLDFFPILYEVLDWEEINEVAAYGGYPMRYPHWRFGMEYIELSRSYQYGLSKIYEMVINNDPTYAYLLSANHWIDQKLVMSHVIGHGDFFKNNYMFAPTNRKMVDEMANHATRVRRYMERYGESAVEEFLDICLSLENLIDPDSAFYQPKWSHPEEEPEAQTEEWLEERESLEPRKLRAKGYMDSYINPPQVMEQERERLRDAMKRSEHFPERPERDVLLFLLQHAPLKGWQRDLLGIVREEAYYFAPQGRTKTANEGWACVAADTPVFTDQGLLSMEALVAGESNMVSDGEVPRNVYDRHIIRNHPTIRLRTRRGLVLHGSRNHRILLADGQTWRRLDELAKGDRLQVAGGAGLWPEEEVALSWSAPRRINLTEVAERAGVSLWTVLRHRVGRRVRRAEAVATALLDYDAEENQALPQAVNKRADVAIPERLSPDLGSFLGYLVGDGHISRVKRHLGLTTGDVEQALAFARLSEELFGLSPTFRQDRKKRWRVLLHAENLSDFLVERLGMTTGPSARRKRIPEAVLRSPEPVVRAFLRSYFDSDGYAGEQGVILSTRSRHLGMQTQLLLLNYGILSRRRKQKDGCWHVHVTGLSAQRFAERVGFGLARKQSALQAYVDGHRWFREEKWEDEVVRLEEDVADVYDISVEETHRYAAAGFVNHNSYWHSKLMTERLLEPSEIIDFAEHHSGVMATGPGRFNPYKVGIELWRDIEERWNKGRFGREWEECDDYERKAKWDTGAGLGRQKIFEVRRHYNDVTFIDEFLTEDFVRRHGLFTFDFDPRINQYVISSRDFQMVKQKLLFMLTNFGQPVVEVVDANHANRGELVLRHRYEGIPLKMDEARETLENVYRLWGRPVHLETHLDDSPGVLSYDGSAHRTETQAGEGISQDSQEQMLWSL